MRTTRSASTDNFVRYGAAAPCPARVAADDACEQGLSSSSIAPLPDGVTASGAPSDSHERQDLFLCTGGQHAAAGDDDRAFGRAEKAHDISRRAVGRGRPERPGTPTAARSSSRDVNGLGRHHVPRTADVHRPGAAGRRDPEPVGDEVGDAGRHFQLAHPLRDRSEDGSAVDVLKVVAVARRARSLLDEQHDWRGRQVGLDDPLHHVRRADARHAADARLPAHLRVAVGHERTGPFVPDGDRPDAAAAGRSQLSVQCRAATPFRTGTRRRAPRASPSKRRPRSANSPTGRSAGQHQHDLAACIPLDLPDARARRTSLLILSQRY